jgi:hypothetical protein
MVRNGTERKCSSVSAVGGGGGGGVRGDFSAGALHVGTWIQDGPVCGCGHSWATARPMGDLSKMPTTFGVGGVT